MMRRYKYAVGWHFAYAALVIVVAVIVTSAMNFATESILTTETDRARGDLERSISVSAARLESNFEHVTHVAHEISAAIAIRPGLSDAALTVLVDHLKSDHADQQIVIVASDGPKTEDQILFYTGVDPNQLSYLRQNPKQIAAIAQAAASAKDSFSGPISMPDSSPIYLLNAPVLLPDKSFATSSYWGTVTVSTELDRIFSGTGISDLARAYQLVVSVLDDNGSPDLVLLGEAGVLGHDFVSQDIEVFGQVWRISAAPIGGWDQDPEYLPIVTKRLWVYGIVFLILSVLALRFHQRTTIAEKRLSDAINSLGDGFVLYDDRDRLVLWNRRYEELYGSAARLLKPGVRFEDLARASVRLGLYSSAVGREDEWVEERIAIHKKRNSVSERMLQNGTWLRVTESAASAGGTVGLHTDVTELVTAKLDAESASKAKSDFLSVVSHELRTPLTTVLGYLRFIQKLKELPKFQRLQNTLTKGAEGTGDIAQQIDEVVDETITFADRARRSGDHLLTLINGFLDLSRIEAGKVDCVPVQIPLKDFLGSLCQEILPSIEARGLELIDKSDEIVVVADKMHLRQVMLNLLENAIKFTATGTITVETIRHEDHAEIRVTDTGRGIETDDQSSLFQRFTQVDNSSTREFGGVGLGLAISRELVRINGGDIGVSSKIGEGSTFWFTLPIKLA